MRKPAIEARQGHARGIDDIGRAIVDATKTSVGKDILEGVRKAGKDIKKGVSKAINDIPDPAFKGKVYNKKGGFTKAYKDSVLRRSAGQF